MLQKAQVRSLLMWLLTAACLAAQGPEPPRVYAIENARIMPVAGPAIERGTVVLRDGLIEAVGAGVVAPKDAWTIDGEGLTVYPAFLDARSTLGTPAPRPASGGKLSRGPEDRPATTPWVRAADLFTVQGGDVEKWRSGGFGSVVVTPQRGIFPGRLSLLNLGDGEPREQVVAPSVGLAIRIPEQNEAYSGYPSALLGRIAYVRQIFLDARTQQQALARYQENPVGLERPVYDRALDPLIEILEKGQPALYPANTAIEIGRALRLAAEESAPRFVIYGVQQAYQEDLASRLRSENAAVILDVSWPKAPNDPDPEDEPSLRMLRFRKQAPSSAAALAAAGVPFGFYGSEANGPEDLLSGVRKAIEAGLAEDDAVRALTLGAAEIYGVDDRIGSIEPGKIANLAVFEENPFEKKAQPKMVFIDGRRYEVE